MARRARRWRPRRWIWLILMPMLLVGAWFGYQGFDSDPAGGMAQAFGPIEHRLQLDRGWAVISPVKEGGRLLGYVVQDGAAWYTLGPVHALPGAGPVHLTVDDGLLVVQTERDGAPQFAAYQPGEGGLVPADYYTLRAPAPSVKAGHYVLVDKQQNALWHYQDGRLVKAYRVSTGRQTAGPLPTCQDFATNFATPEGRFHLTQFVENPAYTTLRPGEQNYAGGAPGNPLGTRWMGFVALDLSCDSGGIYAIHGTHEPERLGTWASDGCIRMDTREAEELFARLAGQRAVIEISGS